MELYNLLLHILEEYLHFAVMGERTDPDHTVVGGVEKVQGDLSDVLPGTHHIQRQNGIDLSLHGKFPQQ